MAALWKWLLYAWLSLTCALAVSPAQSAEQYWLYNVRPDGAEQRLLNTLFSLARQDSRPIPPSADSDIQSRIAQVQQVTSQLRELRRFIDDSLANMADGVLAVDGFGRIMLANARAAW